MAFEEAAKTLLFSILGAGFLFAYLGVNLNPEKETPLRILFVTLAVLTVPLGIGIGWNSVIEQGGGVPSSVQTDIINMGNALYGTFIWVFVFVAGYMIIRFIQWLIVWMVNRRQQKLVEEEDPTL